MVFLHGTKLDLVDHHQIRLEALSRIINISEDGIIQCQQLDAYHYCSGTRLDVLHVK